jgi:hypothetical protein
LRQPDFHGSDPETGRNRRRVTIAPPNCHTLAP